MPVVVTLIGIAWLQAGAWAVEAVMASGSLSSKSIAYAFSARLILLGVFQLLLRPDVHFY